MNKAAVFITIGILLISGSATMLSAVEPVDVEIPPADELIAMIKPEHPRLFLDAKRIEELKQLIKTNPVAEKYYDQLHGDGLKILGEPPSTYEIPDGIRLLSVSRRVVKRVYTLALLYHLEGDQKYVDRTWEELNAAADFKDWNPRHFLDTAEMTHAFAIGYDWLYHQWNDEQRQILREAIVRHGLTPGLANYRKETGFVIASHNWNQVCNGGLCAGAIAIAEQYPELAGEILNSGLDSFRLPMAVYNPDGAWPEGPSYWSYANRYTALLMAAMQSALGTDFGFSQVKGFNRTGHFPIYMTSPIGRTFNFADAGSGAINAPHLYYYASLFNEPAYRDYQHRYGGGQALDLLWYQPESMNPAEAGWSRDACFKGEVETACFRGSWTNPDATYTAIRAGNNFVNHAHLDIGSFILDSLGERWITDLGSDNYNLPDYWNFPEKRWYYYRLRAEGHNTLVINPNGSADQKIFTYSPITRFDPNSDSPFVICDLSDTYHQEKGAILRGLKLINRRDVLVQDEISLDNPSHLYWFAHTMAEVEIRDDGKMAIMRQNGKIMRVRLLSPANGKLTVMDAKPLPASPNPEGQRSNADYRKLSIHLQKVQKTKIAVLFEVMDVDGDPVQETKVVELTQW